MVLSNAGIAVVVGMCGGGGVVGAPVWKFGGFQGQ